MVLKILIAIGPFFIGIYYEWISCIITLFLLFYLLQCYRKKGLLFRHSITFYSTLIITVSYGFSTFWAVDHGMAIWGFIKYLPLPLFILALEQHNLGRRENLLEWVPYSAFLMTISSAICAQIEPLQNFFLVNERLAGFFQYPNTFALYLLIGMVLVICQKEWRWQEAILISGLLCGIVLSGSRTVFLLTGGTIFASGFLLKEKKKKIILFSITGIGTAVVILYVLLSGNVSSIGRIFTTSLSSSTLIGRLLYYKDAFPVILKHPFGLGYLGYYYSQGAFQTGVYSVMNVHNELLQLLLDIGWIPTIIFLYAVVKGFQKGNDKNRMIILLISCHCMLDFDLQFVAVFFILLTAIYTEGKKTSIVKKKRPIIVSGILIGVLSLYFGTVSMLYYFDYVNQALTLYPGYTSGWMHLLTEVETPEEMDIIADKILTCNENNPLANSAKARVAYSKGDFTNVILYKQKAIEYARYSQEEYLDFFEMLYVGEQLYRQNGDMESSRLCIEYMKKIPEMMEEVLDQTDALAYKITDKPELEFPREYEEILDTY